MRAGWNLAIDNVLDILDLQDRCATCKQPFDDASHQDCGGDCLPCMAECGDPDCISALATLRSEIRPGNPMLVYVNTLADVRKVATSLGAFGIEGSVDMRAGLSKLRAGEVIVAAMIAVSHGFRVPSDTTILFDAKCPVRGALRMQCKMRADCSGVLGI